MNGLLISQESLELLEGDVLKVVLVADQEFIYISYTFRPREGLTLDEAQS